MFCPDDDYDSRSFILFQAIQVSSLLSGVIMMIRLRIFMNIKKWYLNGNLFQMCTKYYNEYCTA